MTRGGLIYLDGANMNAILGITRPGDFGADMMHYNPHKTFSGPHGGGGPGAGPICVAEKLGPLSAVAGRRKARDGSYRLDYDRPQSIGRVRSFFGNVGVLVRAYCYIRTHGPDGLKAVAENAVLNANYLLSRVKHILPVPQGDRCMHEFVATRRAAEEEERRLRDGHRQAAAGLRLSRADGLFSADRSGSDDDRADRDREQGNARRLRRDAVPHHRRAARAAARSAAQHAHQPAGRSPGRAPADDALEGRYLVRSLVERNTSGTRSVGTHFLAG